MNSNKGFTLIQTIVTVAVVGVLAAIASTSYGKHLAKAQLSEAISMLEQHKVQSVSYLVKNNTCENPAIANTKGKYGELTVSGTVVPSSLRTTAQRKTGCQLTYTFNNSNVQPELKGKKIVVDIYNNSILSKVAQTNVDSFYLPKTLTTLTEEALPDTHSMPVAEPAYVAKDTEALVEPEPLGGWDLPYRKFTVNLNYTYRVEEFQNGNLTRGEHSATIQNATVTFEDGGTAKIKKVGFGTAWITGNPCGRCNPKVWYDFSGSPDAVNFEKYTKRVMTITKDGNNYVFTSDNGVLTKSANNWYDFTRNSTATIELYK